MRILVTGAAGFIGSTVVDQLLADGHQVVGIDNLAGGRISNLDNAQRSEGFTFVEASVTTSELFDIVAGAAPDVVMHLAAQVDVRKSVEDPQSDARTNVLGTINVLEASRKAGVRRIVFAASGGSRYGEPAELPVAESARANPLSPYAAAKIAGELYVGAYAGMYGLTPINLALSNVYGPRQNPYGDAGVVAVFGAAMLAGRPATIYGDGTGSRDYVYVGDVAGAFVRAGCAPATVTGTFNIGTGLQTTTTELHRLMSAAIGIRASARYADARTGEVQAIALDCARAAEQLRWQPSVDIREGVRRTIRWLRDELGSDVTIGRV